MLFSNVKNAVKPYGNYNCLDLKLPCVPVLVELILANSCVCKAVVKCLPINIVGSATSTQLKTLQVWFQLMLLSNIWTDISVLLLTEPTDKVN